MHNNQFHYRIAIACQQELDCRFEMVVFKHRTAAHVNHCQGAMWHGWCELGALIALPEGQIRTAESPTHGGNESIFCVGDDISETG